MAADMKARWADPAWAAQQIVRIREGQAVSRLPGGKTAVSWAPGGAMFKAQAESRAPGGAWFKAQAVSWAPGGVQAVSRAPGGAMFKALAESRAPGGKTAVSRAPGGAAWKARGGVVGGCPTYKKRGGNTAVSVTPEKLLEFNDLTDPECAAKLGISPAFLKTVRRYYNL